jgi:hypothetical protein
MAARQGSTIVLAGRGPSDEAPQGTDPKGVTGKRLRSSRPDKRTAPDPRSSDDADGRQYSLREPGRDHTVISEKASESSPALGRAAKPEQRRTASNPRAESAAEDPASPRSDSDEASPRDGLPTLLGRAAAHATGELVVTLTYAPDLDSQVSAIMAVLGELPGISRRPPP